MLRILGFTIKISKNGQICTDIVSFDINSCHYLRIFC